MAPIERSPARAGLLRQLSAPLYLPTVLTGAKSFADNPVIGSPLLNRLGLHTGRIRLAQAMSELRRLPLMLQVSAEERAAFRRDGFILKENFLPQDHFERLNSEVRAFKGPGWECHQGDTITHRILLDQETLSDLPATQAFIEHPTYRRLLAWSGARAGAPVFYIQRILNHLREGAPDPQRHLHTDTFHPTVKAWLFLDDVDERKGPFTYVPGSHRFTRQRLAAEYRRSLTARHDPLRYSARGSFRWSEQDLKELGLPPPKAFAVPRNTLVIADTSGIHCRGEASDPGVRLEIWAFSRISPFWPLSLPAVGPVTRLRDRLVRSYLEHQDSKARRRGKLPPWRRVGAERLADFG
ncbi:phytanoyl-CoA dioxygenase family protein [Aquibaculum sediminis]|uniref:phytanoyl-CoA dioxygenase family protein n=1 Tax=Aquibaculum sediminis TaxID=3231907 RepID=UPI0034523FAE